MQLIDSLSSTAGRLWRSKSGLSAMEFALGAPMLMILGGYGIEVANLAATNMRVSQYALQIADNASRIGVNSGLSVYPVSEADMNDVLQGLRLFGANAKLTTNGRITVSSLENIKQNWDTGPNATQRIHWQRCIGKRGVNASGTVEAGFDSTYGTTTTASGTATGAAYQGTDKTAGMGDTGAMVNAPANSGVIFVEINYEYQPVFGSLFVSPTKLHYVASAIIRDRRDYSQLFNPGSAAVASTCNLHTA